MTINEKQRAAEKRADPNPYCIAMAVVTPMHMLECEDGIPPESTTALKFHWPFLYRYVKTFITWAINHAKNPATKERFSRTSPYPASGAVKPWKLKVIAARHMEPAICSC